MRYILTILLSLSAHADTYTARGFQSRDAMLSAYFALPSEVQASAKMDTPVRDDSCRWADPFLLVYPSAAGAVPPQTPYDVSLLSPFDEWRAWMGYQDGSTRTYQTGHADHPFIVVKWVGPFCVGLR